MLIRKPELEDSDSRQSTDSRFSIAFPALSEDCTHLLSSWPKVCINIGVRGQGKCVVGGRSLG